MIFNEKEECQKPGERKEVQSERLRKLIARVYERVPFYKKKFNELKLKPEHIKSLDDIEKLPFTVKNDLRDNYPFGLFASPMKDILEIHASSGTTGKPTVVAYTKNDIKLWSVVMARAIACAGGTPNDIIHNAYGYGLFTGGLGIHYGALELGATVVPISSGGTKRALMLMRDFGCTVLTCTPSFALYMAEEALDAGIDPSKTTLKVGIFGAEPWSEGMRREIEKNWNIKATDIYGLSEIIGPGVAQECAGQDGLHVFSDFFYPEVIDPVTGKPVAEGEKGELVFTTLTKEALPLIRYRTGDIVSITNEPCKGCKRTFPRMSKIMGRTDDMLIIRGVNVFPSQIESVLLQVEGAEPHYLIVVDRQHSMDVMEIQVEVNEKIFSDEVKKLEDLAGKIKKEIESVLGIMVSIKLVEPKTIERSLGKAKRVLDKRKI
ncbi:MAG: phenylacetate--CoA ligase [Candidatus Aureabacteria bacterium]|nr:phenylacetate--CoA ligase [Candidatus Auribacterota bacterium]